jgi:hypothetical protein
MISPRCRNPDTSDPQVAHTREDEDRAMRTWSALLIAAPVAIGLLAAPAAHADWRHQGGGWGGGRHYEQHRGNGGGDAVAGALIGLGVGALIGGMIAASQPPPQYYAPQPQYYAPPPVAYAPPPYAAPAYYAGPRY